jgi:peptide/nickel transport system substrate-binding protein
MSRRGKGFAIALAMGVALALVLSAALPAGATVHKMTGLYGGTLRVAVQGPIDLNPFTATGAESWKVIPLVYDSLARIDSTSLVPVPWAAKSWTVSGENLTVDLRTDLVFHDGSSLTVADVVYSYTEYKAIGLVPSDLTIATSGSEVTFSSATGGGLFYGQALTLPIVKDGTGITNAPVGSGPWIPPATVAMPLTLTANANHFQLPFLDAVTFTAYADTAAASEALLRGDLDLIGWTLGVDEPSAIIDVDGVNMTLLNDASVLQNPGLTQLVVGFNMDPAKMTSDDALRMALAKTLNPILYGQIYPSTVISRSPVIQEDLPWFNPDVTVYQVLINAYPRSSALLTESLQLLDQAGYLDVDHDGIREAPDGSAFSLTVVGIPVEENARTFTIQEAATDVFSRLGLDVRLQVEPSATILDRVGAGDYDVFVASLETSLDPAFMWDWLHSAGTNLFNVANGTLDGYLDAANAALDMTERQDWVDKAQALAMDMGFVVPVLHFNAIEATVRGTFEGWVNMPGGVNNFWTYMNLHAEMVGSLTADLTLVPSSVRSGEATTAIVRVVDQDGIAVDGATIILFMDGARFTTATTDTTGTVRIDITAPAVDGATDVEISLRAIHVGYVGATASAAVTVRPDVSALSVSVSSDKVTMASGEAATITVEVTSGGQAVAGATVSLAVVGLGGGVADTSGTTDSQGRFTTSFTADVGPRTQFRILASASADGFEDGTGSTTVLVEQRVGDVEPRLTPGLDVAAIATAIILLIVIVAIAAVYARRK